MDAPTLTPEEAESAARERVLVDFSLNAFDFRKVAADLICAHFGAPDGARVLAAANVSLADLLTNFRALTRALEEAAERAKENR